MKVLQPTTKFKKDLKKYKNKPNQLAELKVVLNMLMNEQPIPAKYKPHPLEGDYNDCMECHIQSDYLLIWFDKDNDVIKLIRLGSHSELFK